MRVFVTGGSGFVGLPTIRELISHKHTVLALARSSASANILTKAGAEVHRGDLNDLESLRSGASQCDGVIHLGFANDGYSFTAEAFAKAIATEQATIAEMAEALSGTGKALVITSGTFIVAGQERATEDSESMLPAEHPFRLRGVSEELVKRLSKEKNVRGMTVRLSPTVHGAGDRGFVPMLADSSKKNGFVTVVDGGKTRWPAVHKADAAVLFRLAVENGKAGAVYHGVAEEVETGKTMELVGKKLRVPVKNMSVDEAMKSIGFMGFMLGTDSPVSSEKTQKELGWTPREPGLLADVEANYSFSA